MKTKLSNIKTASDVKRLLSKPSFFFDSKTMRFFGDTMKSFGVRTIDGKRVMFRKPGALVNVFGKWKHAGREYFGAWDIVALDDGSIALERIYDETEVNRIYSQIQ